MQMYYMKNRKLTRNRCSCVGLITPGSPRHAFKKQYHNVELDNKNKIVVIVDTVGAIYANQVT